MGTFNDPCSTNYVFPMFFPQPAPLWAMVFSGGYAAYAFEQEMNGPTWVQPAGRGAAPQCEPFEVELISQINRYMSYMC
jgi:hypothetical protein